MKLGKKQERFSLLLSQLIAFIYSMGYQVRMGDVFAHNGHMENSNHYIKLAADLNLFKDGVYLTKTEDHEIFGEYWKSLDDLCRWGGDFTRKDGNHYSLFHQGRA